jgi:Alpha/beta hydrolase domain
MYTSLYIMRSGHAWVCVGSQKTSVDNSVKASNPKRYEAVHIRVAHAFLHAFPRHERPPVS